MALAFDPDTISFYDREATPYAKSSQRSTHIDAFIAAIGAGAKVLELGCGAGHDAEALIAAGIDVTAMDASSKLAAIASARIGRPVRVMRFDEITDVDVFDGMWANACLLHVPVGSLAGVLASVHASLRSGGVFCASFKAGDGEGRDRLGRYYNFPRRIELERFYASAGAGLLLASRKVFGGGYDGVERPWLACTAFKRVLPARPRRGDERTAGGCIGASRALGARRAAGVRSPIAALIQLYSRDVKVSRIER